MTKVMQSGTASVASGTWVLQTWWQPIVMTAMPFSSSNPQRLEAQIPWKDDCMNKHPPGATGWDVARAWLWELLLRSRSHLCSWLAALRRLNENCLKPAGSSKCLALLPEAVRASHYCGCQDTSQHQQDFFSSLKQCPEANAVLKLKKIRTTFMVYRVQDAWGIILGQMDFHHPN